VKDILDELFITYFEIGRINKEKNGIQEIIDLNGMKKEND